MLPTARSWWPRLPPLLLLLPLLVRGAPAPATLKDPDTEEVVPSRMPSNKIDELVIAFSAFGQTFALRLKPDATFLAPDVKVETVGNSYGAAEEDLHPRGCFYSGTVNGVPQSLAAVSVCHGLIGSFVLHGQEFTLQPRDAGHAINRPHLLQRWGTAVAPTAAAPVAPGAQADRRRQTRGLQGNDTVKCSRNRDAAGQEPRRHQKRSLSRPRYVETVLVADETVTEFYRGNLQNHILTLMSVVARIFKHASIGNFINVVLVKILIIRDAKSGPAESRDAQRLLRNFCSWQQNFNPYSDEHPEHYDAAVLLTRKSFCLSKNNCDTLGIANIDCICDSKRSCAVVSDMGLPSAYTMAHELGHVLNMHHDEDDTCVKKFGIQGKHHLMAAYLKRVNRTLPWSPCSAGFLTDLLDKGEGDCLLDEPVNPLTLPTGLPGTNPFYDLDQQCRQLFAPDYSHCKDFHVEPCSKIWCHKNGHESECRTKVTGLNWLDGSPCGDRKVCLDGSCLPMEEVEKTRTLVDGSWSSWGSWGECSRTCGGGVQYAHRDCTNPAPQNGGDYCVGLRTTFRSCNTDECPDGENFREVQCAQFNNVTVKDDEGNVIHWLPKYAGVLIRDRCKLTCRIRGKYTFKVFKSKVEDGTPCGLDTDSVCVNGHCIEAGCDHVLGSPKRRDDCGVCGGNGTTCKQFTGIFNPTSYGYNDIITFPAGTTNIDVKQPSEPGLLNDHNYLALKDVRGNYLLNGAMFVTSTEQDINLNGTIIQYSGNLVSLERLQIFQPLPEPVTLELLTLPGEKPPPTIKFCFSLPNHVEFNRPLPPPPQKVSGSFLTVRLDEPQWVVGEWHNCSSICGAGWQLRLVECRYPSGELADTCDQEEKPTDLQACKNQACPE